MMKRCLKEYSQSGKWDAERVTAAITCVGEKPEEKDVDLLESVQV